MAARRRPSNRSAARRSSRGESESTRPAAGTKRRSAAAGARSRSRTRASSASSGPRAGRDGKFPVSCPRCAAKYNVPEEYLDTVVTCKHCKSSFTPRNAAGSARRPQQAKGGSAFLRIGFIALPFILVIIVVNLTKKEKKPEVKPVDTTVWLSQEDEPVRVLADFFRAVEKKNGQVIAVNLDWDHQYEKVPKKEKTSPNWKLLSPEARKTFQDKFCDDLYKGALGVTFKEFGTEDFEWHEQVEFKPDAKAFTLMLEFPNKERRTLGLAKVSGDVKLVGSSWKVFDWNIVFLPASARQHKTKLAMRKKHKTLKTPKYETITIKGKKYKSYQGEEVPMDHLPDTPPAMRKKIDHLIDSLFTETDDPKAGTLAAVELQDIGKPAVPRILQALYEHKCKTQFERETFGILIKTYNNIRGAGVPWLPDDDVGSSFGGTNEDRQKLVKAVFGDWWFHYHKKAEQFGGDTDEELDKAFNAGSKGSTSKPKKEKKTGK